MNIQAELYHEAEKNLLSQRDKERYTLQVQVQVALDDVAKKKTGWGKSGTDV
jgi:hypothetical protein